MFVLDDLSVSLLRQAARLRVPLSRWNEDPSQWRKAWALGWEVVGQVHVKAVPRAKEAA